MKWSKLLAASLAMLSAVTGSAAWAHGYHHHGARVGVGVVVGAPLGWYYPPTYYYRSPPVIVTQAAPTVYVERGPDGPVQAQSDGYWYYCQNTGAYYPYVRECPSPWQRVPAQPSPQ
jgi:hypothetical protein